MLRTSVPVALALVLAAPFAAERCGCAITTSRAGEPSARAFVASVYAPYIDRHSEGAGLDSPDSYYRTFEPGLAALLIKKSDAEIKQRVAGSSHDILVDADTWTIEGLKIVVILTGPRTATAFVAFTNIGEKTTLKLELMKLGIGWRIADIVSKSGDLRARAFK